MQNVLEVGSAQGALHSKAPSGSVHPPQNLNPESSSLTFEETIMSKDSRLTYSMPGRPFDDEENAGYAMFNDSLGTVHIADSTGLDEEMETGDAKTYNFPTHED